MKTDTTLSRRRLLAGVPAVAAVGVPSVATALGGLSAGATIDPIFGLIAAQRETMRALTAAFRKQSAMEEADGDDGWNAGCIDVDDAHDCDCDALAAVLTTPPTPLGGVAALLEHCGLPRFPDEKGATTRRNDSILRDAGLCCQEDVQEAARGFLPIIAATLRKLLPA
jgi:hypothetical protein